MPRWAREAMISAERPTTAAALLSCSELSKVFLSAALSPRVPTHCEEAVYRAALFSSLWATLVQVLTGVLADFVF